MDSSLCALCFNVFDRVMESPLGLAVDSYFTCSAPEGVEYLPSLNRIRQKLLARAYTSLDEYFTEISDTIIYLSQYFPKDSDVALALQNLQLMITEQSKGIKAGNNQNWRDSISELVERVRKFSENAPNSSDAFDVFCATTENREESEEEQPVPSPDISHIDLKKMKSMIRRLETDEDEQELFQLVQRMEPGFAKPHRMVEIDLRKMYPETILRIHSFLHNKQLRCTDSESLTNSPFFIQPIDASPVKPCWIPTPVPTPKTFLKDEPQ